MPRKRSAGREPAGTQPNQDTVKESRWEKGVVQPSLTPAERKFLRAVDRLSRVASEVTLPGPPDPRLVEAFFQYYTTGEVAPREHERFSDRAREIMGARPAWQAAMGLVDDAGDSDMMLPLDELLRHDWKEGLRYLSKWLYANAGAATDLFQSPKDYAGVVLWAGLCSLKFTDEQVKSVRAFLGRIIKNVMRRADQGSVWVPVTNVIREQLGYTSDRDTRLGYIRDRDDLLKHEIYQRLIFTTLLLDTYLVSKSVMTYLYKAARSHLLTLLREATAKSRPRIQLYAFGEEDDENEEGMLAPARLVGIDRLTAEVAAQLDAVDGTVAAEAEELFTRYSLTPREQEVAVLLWERFDETDTNRGLNKAIAGKMNISEGRVSQLRRSIGRKLKPLMEERARTTKAAKEDTKDKKLSPGP